MQENESKPSLELEFLKCAQSVVTKPHPSRDELETAVGLKHTHIPPFVYGSHNCGHTVQLDSFRKPHQNTTQHQNWTKSGKTVPEAAPNCLAGSVVYSRVVFGNINGKHERTCN